MSQFLPGQRWISETEPELGLGTILNAEANRVTVQFIASGERRTYAADNSPLARARYSPGDRVESAEGWSIKVLEVDEHQGLLSYKGVSVDGEAKTLEEIDLNHFLQFNKPQDRLFIGQIDSPALFSLRYRTLRRQGELHQSTVSGLCGPRTSLIPHQLFIAHEVAHRHAPRVLLADEVGLGKTIEAGLIMHHQLLNARAERILILVPEPLLHQWLVEMRRRFNLHFSLFDEERYLQLTDGNPFLAEQLVLCSLDLFQDEPERQVQALQAEWDLCVIDEAHHLEWSEGEVSEEYLFVEALAAKVAGLLLLTATPEQLGKRSHFARLRLLDPDRFYDYDEFLAEERQYEPLAKLIRHLTEDHHLDGETLAQLVSLTINDRSDELVCQLDDPATADTARQELINLLLDRHGTGRILFRNTRATVKGFPERRMHAYELAASGVYLSESEAQPLDALLFPETAYAAEGESTEPWWKVDPRVSWLVETLKRLRPEKALVICAKAQTAVDLEDALRTLGGIGAGVFHEKLSIIARDRAAAWFADEEDGAQVLVCSEIGSEGRNFQFAHHLILFDLPLNPDLLEQRIGRLDRIGQRNTIHIHVPYLKNRAQEVLFNWYHYGLDAFNRQCPAGHIVFSRLRDVLETLLRQPEENALSKLIEQAKGLTASILDELHEGRDRLLELNSCRKEEAERLIEQVQQLECDDQIWPYLEDAFDAFGVTVEEHSEDCYILMPGDHMRVSQFPELPEDGVTVTLSRAKALAREDMLFLTWEHPMVRSTMDLILNSEQGNAAFGIVRHDDLDPGQLLLEAIFLVECAAPKHLGVTRYLPQTLIRVLADNNLQDLSAIPMEQLSTLPQPIDREHVATLLRGQRKLIESMIRFAERTAKQRLPQLIAESSQHMLANATGELKRLSALRKVNPYVRQEELDRLKQNAMEMHGHLQATQLRLDALRVLLTA